MRGIDQYRLDERGMSLAEFQYFYWWKWGHLSARPAAGPGDSLFCCLLLAQGGGETLFALTLVGIGALGGLQSTVG